MDEKTVNTEAMEEKLPSMDDFKEELEASFKRVKTGDIMKATIVPMVIAPSRTIIAPTMQTMTYPKFPMKVIMGIMLPAKDIARNPLCCRSELIVSNCVLALSTPL